MSGIGRWGSAREASARRATLREAMARVPSYQREQPLSPRAGALVEQLLELPHVGSADRIACERLAALLDTLDRVEARLANGRVETRGGKRWGSAGAVRRGPTSPDPCHESGSYAGETGLTGSAWIRPGLVWEQGVAGSNPAVPIGNLAVCQPSVGPGRWRARERGKCGCHVSAVVGPPRTL
jgi:hypothetical protein